MHPVQTANKALSLSWLVPLNLGCAFSPRGEAAKQHESRTLSGSAGRTALSLSATLAAHSQSVGRWSEYVVKLASSGPFLLSESPTPRNTVSTGVIGAAARRPHCQIHPHRKRGLRRRICSTEPLCRHNAQILRDRKRGIQRNASIVRGELLWLQRHRHCKPGCSLQVARKPTL